VTDVLPSARYDLSGFGEMLAEPSRAAILLSLMDGGARPAGELARIAGITPQTASSHLRRLLQGGMLVVEGRGRHRYFRLSGETVADALEAVALLRRPRDVPRSPERAELAEARTCYLHLAGRLGVAWLEALEKLRFLQLTGGVLSLTGEGVDRFATLELRPPHWVAGKPCLDWTERRFHLGGGLGALLTRHLFERGWLARRTGSRAVRVTSSGARVFAREFSLSWP